MMEKLISQWNETRLEIFWISKPDKNNVFHGNIRFFYQDLKNIISTKCVKLSSDDNVENLLDLLIEKFNIDLKMLSTSSQDYCLMEIFPDGESLVLNSNDRPLIRQLNWLVKKKDGRFLMKYSYEEIANDFYDNKFDKADFNRSGNRKSIIWDKPKHKKDERPDNSKMVKMNDFSMVAKNLYKIVPETSMNISRLNMIMGASINKTNFNNNNNNNNNNIHNEIKIKIYTEDYKSFRFIIIKQKDIVKSIIDISLKLFNLQFSNNSWYLQLATENKMTSSFVILYKLELAEKPYDVINSWSSKNSELVLILTKSVKLSDSIKNESILLVPYIRSKRNRNQTVDNYYLSIPGLTAFGSDQNICKRAVRNIFGVDCDKINIIQHENVFPIHFCISVSFNNNDIECCVFPVGNLNKIEIDGTLISDKTFLKRGQILKIGDLSLIIDAIDSSLIEKSNYTAKIPIEIIVKDGAIDALLSTCIYNNDIRSENNFKVIMAFSIYIVLKSYINESDDFKEVAIKICDLTATLVKENSDNLWNLIYILVNSAELFNFIIKDKDLIVLSKEFQNSYFIIIQDTIKWITFLVKKQLNKYMVIFYDPSASVDISSLETINFESVKDDFESEHTNYKYNVVNLLAYLNNFIQKLCYYKMNAGITVQLFAILFDFLDRSILNMFLEYSNHNSVNEIEMCLERLYRRIMAVYYWSETQGLEMAVECHLIRSFQMIEIMKSQTINELKTIVSDCSSFSENELTYLISILKHKLPIKTSIHDFTKNSNTKRNQHNELAIIFPNDGFNVETIEQNNHELIKFLKTLESTGMCKIRVNQQSTDWMIDFQNDPQNNEQIVIEANSYSNLIPSEKIPIKRLDLNNSENNYNKNIKNDDCKGYDNEEDDELQLVNIVKSNGTLGLSIVTAKHSINKMFGTYVKDIASNGPAFNKGINIGDQILRLNDVSIMGLNQNSVLQIISNLEGRINMLLLKNAGFNHGISCFVNKSQNQLPKSQSNNSIQIVPSFDSKIENIKPIQDNNVHLLVPGPHMNSKYRSDLTDNFKNVFENQDSIIVNLSDNTSQISDESPSPPIRPPPPLNYY